MVFELFLFRRFQRRRYFSTKYRLYRKRSTGQRLTRNDDSPAIVWDDREKGVLFILTAHVSEDVLIKMAENIVEKNN